MNLPLLMLIIFTITLGCSKDNPVACPKEETQPQEVEVVTQNPINQASTLPIEGIWVRKRGLYNGYCYSDGSCSEENNYLDTLRIESSSSPYPRPNTSYYQYTLTTHLSGPSYPEYNSQIYRESTGSIGIYSDEQGGWLFDHSLESATAGAFDSSDFIDAYNEWPIVGGRVIYHEKRIGLEWGYAPNQGHRDSFELSYDNGYYPIAPHLSGAQDSYYIAYYWRTPNKGASP